jgi:phage recombination protein Bet
MTNAITNKKEMLDMVRIIYPHLKDVSDVELMKAIALVNKLGLDPLKREVHFVPFKNSVQVVVSYLEYVKRAEKTGLLNGWEVEVGKDELGEYAIVRIYRKDWQYPFTWKTYLNEVKKDTATWKQMPIFMLKKVAITQAFRICFPNETSYLPYEEAEAGEQEQIETKTISEKQRKFLWTIAKEENLTEEEVREIIKSFGYESTKDISIEVFDSIMNAIREAGERKKLNKETEDERNDS